MSENAVHDVKEIGINRRTIGGDDAFDPVFSILQKTNRRFVIAQHIDDRIYRRMKQSEK